jgi:Haem-binding domain
MSKVWVRRILLGLGGLLLAIQVVPYGRAHTNPPVSGQPTWDSPRTQELFGRACADCHSHQTQWPWYSNVAPVSWLVQRDVDEGRSHFNVSTWGVQRHNEGEEAAEMLQTEEMPPWFYLPAHPEARLSAAEKAELTQGLIATFGAEGEGEGGRGRGRGRGGEGEGEEGEGRH